MEKHLLQQLRPALPAWLTPWNKPKQPQVLLYLADALWIIRSRSLREREAEHRETSLSSAANAAHFAASLDLHLLARFARLLHVLHPCDRLDENCQIQVTVKKRNGVVIVQGRRDKNGWATIRDGVICFLGNRVESCTTRASK